ncbi:hypothetical protein (Partial), partial [Seminavis robusta]|eukprot:Sro4013_g352520.1 n/a (488) ;mRNA; f:2043-3562
MDKRSTKQITPIDTHHDAAHFPATSTPTTSSFRRSPLLHSLNDASFPATAPSQRPPSITSTTMAHAQPFSSHYLPAAYTTRHHQSHPPVEPIKEHRHQLPRPTITTPASGTIQSTGRATTHSRLLHSSTRNPIHIPTAAPPIGSHPLPHEQPTQHHSSVEQPIFCRSSVEQPIFRRHHQSSVEQHHHSSAEQPYRPIQQALLSSMSSNSDPSTASTTSYATTPHIPLPSRTNDLPIQLLFETFTLHPPINPQFQHLWNFTTTDHLPPTAFATAPVITHHGQNQNQKEPCQTSSNPTASSNTTDSFLQSLSNNSNNNCSILQPREPRHRSPTRPTPPRPKRRRRNNSSHDSKPAATTPAVTTKAATNATTKAPQKKSPTTAKHASTPKEVSTEPHPANASFASGLSSNPFSVLADDAMSVASDDATPTEVNILQGWSPDPLLPSRVAAAIRSLHKYYAFELNPTSEAVITDILLRADKVSPPPKRHTAV